MAKKGKNVIKVDFTDVDLEGGGGGARLPEGDYVATVKKVERATSKQGNSMLKVTLSVKKKKVFSYFVLDKKNYWKLAQFLKGMGKKVTNKPYSLSPDSWIDEDVGVTLADGEPYNNKIKSEIVEFITVEEAEAGEESEDEDDDDDSDDDEDVDDIELEDEDDL